MTSTTNTSQGTTFMTVLTACVVLAGTASLLAAPTATYRSSEFSTLPDIAAPGSPFDAMFADWGLDTSADLNCDGTIDIHDFLEAMSLADDILLIAVITNWGGGSEFDLNCDGTVGIADFLLMAADMATMDVQGEVDALFADWGLDTSADLNCDGTVDIHDFLDAMSLGDDILLINVITHWGTGSAYDLDCDGTVGMTDYLLLLADMADVAGQAKP